jgi:hypothetical protein
MTQRAAVGDAPHRASRACGLALLLLGAALPSGCGGSSSHTHPPGAAGQATAGSSAGGSEQQRVSQAGARSSGASGVGGSVTLITSEPKGCRTEDGREGLVVDTFPYPSPRPECEPLDQPGTLDTACPEEPRVICVNNECLFDSPLAGCCRAEGVCGLWDSGRFGTSKSLGCISRQPWVDNADYLGETRQSVPCTP